MRASELLGLPVVGPGGMTLGTVLDVRLAQDGPLLGGFAAMRIAGFIVGKHHVSARLGYDRREAQGPAMISWLVRLWTRHNRYLPWPDAELADGAVRSGLAELPGIPPL